MAPKKDKAKKEDDKGGAFTEVERTFLEQQVAECNRKIARLRSALDEYETRNEELQTAYEKLDEDRADIIAYLKKVLNVKNEENTELKEKVKGLEEIRDIESAQFQKKVTELEKNFTIMKDQLTSENKLLAGKLNTLEEFRAIRDDLMKKFEKQEKDFEDQEMKYKRIIYDAEKKFVIGKDKLKKEMEARLLQLAQDFQDATELRVAASTHRVIRENIAISNELDTILSSQRKISHQNEKFKVTTNAAIIAKELAEEERDKAINKNIVQRQVIDKLTTAFGNIKRQKAIFEKKSYDFETLQEKVQTLTKDNDTLNMRIRILEQNLHVKLSDQNKAFVDFSRISKERDKFQNILEEAAIAIQAALKLDQWAHIRQEGLTMDRQLLLSNLLKIVSQYREIQGSDSTATITSFSKVYDEGDLGFVPKLPPKKKPMSSTFSFIQQVQKQQELMKKESKKSITNTSVSETSIDSSIATIPSLQVVSALESKQIPEGETVSAESFIASKESTITVAEDPSSDENLTAMEKQLLASKAEIQKSILKDLAFTQLTYQKSTQMLAKAKSVASIATLRKKSVTIVESDQSLATKSKTDLPDSSTVDLRSADIKEEEENITSLTEREIAEKEIDEEVTKEPSEDDKTE